MDAQERRFWIAAAEEAPDGSGDIVIPLPDELLEAMGWGEGTELDIETDSENGTMVISASRG